MMKTIDIIIETPKGSGEKYTLDTESGYFKLKKLLPSGMVFPFDFGFIPGSKGEDGDPLDALVVSEFKTFPGCMIECRLIGAVLAEQTDKNETIRNDRFFFVPVLSQQFKDLKKMEDVPGIREITDFFIHYNEEQGKEFRWLDTYNATKAEALIKKQGR